MKHQTRLGLLAAASYGPIASHGLSKHSSCLIRPRHRGALGKLHNRNGRDLPSKHQPFQHFGREIGQT